MDSPIAESRRTYRLKDGDDTGRREGNHAVGIYVLERVNFGFALLPAGTLNYSEPRPASQLASQLASQAASQGPSVG